MAFSPIAFTIPEYDRNLYKNWWLKPYEPGTTTPKPMAIDTAGSSQASRFELNSQGFPITAGGAFVIPHIDGSYDLWLFPTSTEADANDTTNALQFADNITPVDLFTSVSSLTNINFNTVADMVADTALKVGNFISIESYTATNNSGVMFGEIVASGTGTADGGSFIDLPNTTPATQFKQNFSSIKVKLFGAEGDKAADDTSAIQAAIQYAYSADATLNKGEVLLGSGSFLVDPTIGLVMKDNIRLIGEGFNSTEIIALSTSPTARVGYTDGIIRRPFLASPGNERVQFVRVCGIRFVIRGDNQTAINAGHMGRSVIQRNRITVQDRAQEFSNLPQTIFTGSKGIVLEAAADIPSGFTGGDACTIDDKNTIEFMETSIEVNGPTHSHVINNNDLQEANTLINITSNFASGISITDNTLQNIRNPGGNRCIDLSGFNCTIEGNYFEPTSAAISQVLFRSGSKGNYVGQNRFDTTTPIVADDGSGNKYPEILNTQTQNTMRGVSHTSKYESTRSTSDQVLNAVGATTLIFNSETANVVDNSAAAGAAINPNTTTNGTYFAPFTGVFTYSITVRLNPDVDAEIQLIVKSGGVSKQVHQDAFLVAGTTYRTFSGVLLAAKDDGIIFETSPITALTSLGLVAASDVVLTISGISSS